MGANRDTVGGTSPGTGSWAGDLDKFSWDPTSVQDWSNPSNYDMGSVGGIAAQAFQVYGPGWVNQDPAKLMQQFGGGNQQPAQQFGLFNPPGWGEKQLQAPAGLLGPAPMDLGEAMNPAPIAPAAAPEAPTIAGAVAPLAASLSPVQQALAKPEKVVDKYTDRVGPDMHDFTVGTLAKTMLGEARGEGEPGMLAVGATVANRARNNWGKLGTSMVDQARAPSQFVGINNPAADRELNAQSPVAQTALRLAESIASGDYSDPTGGAQSFRALGQKTDEAHRTLEAQGYRDLGNHRFSQFSAPEVAAAPAAPQAPEPSNLTGLEVADPNVPAGGLYVPGLKIDYSRMDPNFHFGIDATKEKQEPAGIVIHHSAGAEDQTGPEAIAAGIAENRGYSFYVDKQGNVYQAAPLDKRTNHVKPPGAPQRTDRYDLSNANTFGVAALGKDGLEGGSENTPEQQRAIRAVVDGLVSKYGIDPKNIYGHGEVQRDRDHKEGFSLAQSYRTGEPLSLGTAAAPVSASVAATAAPPASRVQVADAAAPTPPPRPPGLVPTGIDPPQPSQVDRGPELQAPTIQPVPAVQPVQPLQPLPAAQEVSSPPVWEGGTYGPGTSKFEGEAEKPFHETMLGGALQGLFSAIVAGAFPPAAAPLAIASLFGINPIGLGMDYLTGGVEPGRVDSPLPEFGRGSASAPNDWTIAQQALAKPLPKLKATAKAESKPKDRYGIQIPLLDQYVYGDA